MLHQINRSYRAGRGALALAAGLLAALNSSWTHEWIRFDPAPGSFPLATPAGAAPIVFAEEDAPLVALAARHLAEDVEMVTGRRPEVRRYEEGLPDDAAVYVGTLGQSPLIDALVASGKLEVSELLGEWESFVIAVMDASAEGGAKGLAIVGSDRRGTAYGVYELSQAIGVSPWSWWADVPPRSASSLHIASGSKRFGPPSVKYRGIFINDEDWGLHRWAAQEFDPTLGDIGPKTYEQVFELLLRLKANTLWPAMHEVTQAFNLYPENKAVADRYGIVMGSSHAEPMLRNNVTEWTAPKEDYNYATNREGVLAYWEQRVRENGAYENIYTLGMRGIHDSGMTAGGTVEERARLLKDIFEDQRVLLRQHVNANLDAVPQVFTPYKEVLELYQAGLEVPEDVTIMWPNDNHGYIRRFPNAAERARRGGSGVYYHLSYLGSPMAYLWLCSTPPALIWQEMSKAYELGAREYWIVNVGDIKPAEVGMEFFLQMAWDIERWNLDTLPNFLTSWAAREFGSSEADAIASVMAGYYRLNFQRKPEHLQWWLPHGRAQGSTLSELEIRDRLEAYADLVKECGRIAPRLAANARDAFFQLVDYPVRASAYANQRYFHAEQYGRLFSASPVDARSHGALARSADADLKALTHRYNEEIAGGKWRGMMAEEPADNMWRSYRLTPPLLPAPNMVEPLGFSRTQLTEGKLRFAGASAGAHLEIEREAESFDRFEERDGARWRVVPGLGRTGDSVAPFPVSAASVEVKDLTSRSPWLEYEVELKDAGEYRFFANLIPTYPVGERSELRFAIALDDQEPTMVEVARETGDTAWSQAVLTGSLTASVKVEVNAPGRHVLRIYMVDTGVVIDKWFLHRGEFDLRYLGPQPLVTR